MPQLRTDRLSLPAPSAADPILGSSPTVQFRSPGLSYNADVQNPKSLNAVLPADVDTSTGVDGSNVYTRAPQVAHRHDRQRRLTPAPLHDRGDFSVP
ncbi:hypothetical protein GCM10009835_11400 [Planosporangium flavigriseum]|uniref:Uncharacterized protein n=1 Tax=Planosporangium flavigriseum TaxID=373681 RepID=A0A8J3PMT0_9ACTN|nr:hypothetical protein Pfl04_25820 [Planosporangium flavigriseum]